MGGAKGAEKDGCHAMDGDGGPRRKRLGAISRRKVRTPPQQRQVNGMGSGSCGAGSPMRPKRARMRSRVLRAAEPRKP